MSTRLFDVHASLVSTFTAAITDSTVHDGPHPTGNDAGDLVLVGSAGDTLDADDASSQQEQSPLSGAGWRSEQGVVTCSVWVWHGDDDLTALRTRAEALLKVCEDAVRADPSLGGVLTDPGLAEVTAVRFRQQQTTAGAVVRVVFDVSFGALLT